MSQRVVRARLARATWLLVVGLSLAPGAAPCADELSALETALRDANKFVRRDAVEALTRRDEPEAWTAVLEALGDRTGEVADTAAYLAARVPLGAWSTRDRRRWIELMEGKLGLEAKEPWVRRRAAELAGRLPFGLDPRALARALGDDDADVRRLALYSLERRARSQAFDAETAADLAEAVERRCARERVGAVRARALHALDALAPAAAEARLAAALTDDEADVRSAACALVPRRWNTPALQARRDQVLERALADPEPRVRAAAIAAWQLVGDRTAARTLAGRLQRESELALSWRLLDALQSLSGLRYPLDPRPWALWAEHLPEGWNAAEAQAAAPPATSASASQTSSAALFGLPIRSGRLAFLIDFSGSIWREREDGRTPKEILAQHLRAALEALPPETRFLLVPYTAEPHPWRDELVVASKRNVAQALAWFDDAHFEGSGNAWDAIEYALAYEEVDTLVVLTDGAPTGGPRHRLELIVDLLLERNLARHVAFDSVLVDAPKRLQGFWSELARASGGRSLAVALR